MKKPKKNFRETKTVVITIVVGCAVFAVVLATWLYMSFAQISPAKADAICQSFSQDVKSKITSIPGYTVIGASKSCSPEEDELGATDYVMSVTVRVATTAPDSLEAIKSDLNNLSNKYPATNYPIWVDNIPASAGQPEAVCVSASRYIDNDGSDYPQGPPSHYPRYTAPGSIKDFEPCKSV